jgi:AraC-like DNA-binding protein/mannose-6-phosphate isomerase-like protein (cupin superfamily)
VTVATPSAKKVTAPAKLGRWDARSASAISVGTYVFEIGAEVVTGWHSHDMHQLEYAFQGVAQVETASARYLLPPQQAVWIPAGVEHCTTLTRVRTVAVFFDPALGIEAGDQVRVLGVAPVIREMILHARRWPIERPAGTDSASEGAAVTFFTTLAQLISESLDQASLLRLPTSQNPLVDAAMRYTTANLADVTLPAVCAAINTSERSLRRAFTTDTGMSWQQYLLESRLIQAMSRLAQPEPTILSVATEVGFDTMSGFARAFRRYSGETPSAYRRRILSEPGPSPR